MKILSRFALATFLSVAAGAAQAHDYTLGALHVDHPWSRETPAAAPVGGGYLKVENKGATADRLIAVESAASAKVELHEMSVIGGVMKMRPLDKGLEVPAGGTLELKPGGYHVMFVGLKAPFRAGDKVKGTLVFEKAGRLDVDFDVEAMTAKPMNHMHMPGSGN